MVNSVNKKPCKIERMLFFSFLCMCFGLLCFLLQLDPCLISIAPRKNCSGPAERPECYLAGGTLAGAGGGNSVTALPPKSANQETVAGKTLLHSAAKQNSCCVCRRKKKRGMLSGYRVRVGEQTGGRIWVQGTEVSWMKNALESDIRH